MTDRPAPERLKLDEAAEYLRVSRRSLNRLMSAGRIRALQITPGRKVIERRELDAFIAAIRRAA